jgi:hypothetical protein
METREVGIIIVKELEATNGSVYSDLKAVIETVVIAYMLVRIPTSDIERNGLVHIPLANYFVSEGQSFFCAVPKLPS